MLDHSKISVVDLLWWMAAVAVIFVFPLNLALGSQILVMAIFALSYNLVLGYGGIVTLGHGVFFGLGCYASAILANAGWREPITGVLFGSFIATLTGVVLGPWLLRLKGLPLIMVTLAVNAIIFELGNKWTVVTNGLDGVSGFTIDPIFGIFDWSLSGTTAYLYCLGWTFVVFVLMRVIIHSSFGVALRGVKENAVRMALLGNRVQVHSFAAYVIGAAIAGIAGGLSAQVNTFAGLGGLNPSITFDGLMMIVLGGLGSLYGSLLGALIYVATSHIAAELVPRYWLFVFGLLLIFVVRFAKGGVMGVVKRNFLRHPK